MAGQTSSKPKFPYSAYREVRKTISDSDLKKERGEVLQKVIRLAADAFEIPVGQVTRYSKLQGDLDAEAMSAVEFEIGMEKEFNMGADDFAGIYGRTFLTDVSIQSVANVVVFKRFARNGR